MKRTLHLLAAATLLSGITLNGQISPDGSDLAGGTPVLDIDSGPPVAALQSWEVWTVLDRDESSTRREFQYLSTNAVTLKVSPKVLTVTEVGNGLNYFDGTWRESLDLITLTPSGGAAAVFGPHKLYCSPDLSSEAAILIVTRNGQTLATRPKALFYHEPQSAESFLLAEASPYATAELVPPNQLVWRDAFRSDYINADYRLTYSKSGIESDVIFTRKPKAPADCSPKLNGNSVQLQVHHEFVNSPIPAIQTRELGNGLVDEVLDFGDLWFPTGLVISGADVPSRNLDQAASINSPWSPQDATSIPVAKAWRLTEQGSILMESVRWIDIAPRFAKIPDLETHPPGGDGFTSESKFVIAKQPYSPNGVILDYIAVNSAQGYTFTNATYYVSNNVSFVNATFQPGCIVKIAPGKSMLVYGQIACNGTQQSPSVITSSDDDLFGDLTPGTNCPAYSANPAIWMYFPSFCNALNNLRIRWATTAVKIDSSSCNTYYQSFQNTLIESCQTGVSAPNATLFISSSIARDVATPVQPYGYCSVNGSFTSQTSLAKHIRDATSSLSTNKPPEWTPSDSSRLFTTNASGYFVGCNTQCWINGIQGHTSISVSNGPPPYWTQPPCTVITPLHALTVRHVAFSTNNVPQLIGREFRFMDTNGQHYVRQCIGQAMVENADSELAVLLLNAGLPSGVHKARALPPQALDKILCLRNNAAQRHCPSRSVPCIGIGAMVQLDYNQHVFTVDWYKFLTPAMYPKAITHPSDSIPLRSGGVAGGDSGGPAYVLINSELVLLGLWVSMSQGMPDEYTYSSSCPGFLTNAVNTAISTVDTNVLGTNTNYQLQLSSLSGFPDE